MAYTDTAGLLNSNNYALWSTLTRRKLLKNKCWETISGTTPKPTPDDTTNSLNDWTRRSAIGWAIIVLSVDPAQYTYIQNTTCGAEAWRILKRIHRPVSSPRLFTSFYKELDGIGCGWGVVGLPVVAGWFGLVPGWKETVYRWASDAWSEGVSRMREREGDLFCGPHLIGSGGGREEEVCVLEAIVDDIPTSDPEVDGRTRGNGILTPPPTPPRSTTLRENVSLKIPKPSPEEELVSLFSAWHLQTPTTPNPALSILS